MSSTVHRLRRCTSVTLEAEQRTPEDLDGADGRRHQHHGLLRRLARQRAPDAPAAAEGPARLSAVKAPTSSEHRAAQQADRLGQVPAMPAARG